MIEPALAFLCAFVPVTQQGPSDPQPPASVVGFELGSAGNLLTYEKSIHYFEQLAAASPRVTLETIGKTSEGRALRLALVSSSDNLGRLDASLAMLAKVADPAQLDEADEKEILESCPALVWISMSMHATEVGGAQWAPQLAYELATREDAETKRIRDEVVVALLPCTNPDGMTMVANWSERRRKANKATAGLPTLYQRYAGHDNNRDWYMLNLPETRAMTRQLYGRLYPLVVLDMHQMGNRGPRFFVPPYADPVNPNLDPILTQAINLLGTRMAHDMTWAGLSGVVTGTTFDNWWIGGNRNVPFRHNILGILTECASANLADTIEQDPAKLRGMGVNLPRYAAQENFPDPWRGTTWSLADILRYDSEACWSLLRTVARERREYLARKILLGRRAIAGDAVTGEQRRARRGFAIPRADGREAAAAHLVGILQLLGVRVQTMAQPEAGHGGWFVPADQAYRACLTDLLEIQHYPEILDAPPPHGMPIRPYDSAGWTLPAMFRVRVEELAARPEGKLEPAPQIDISDPVGRAFAALEAEDAVLREGSAADHLHLGLVFRSLTKGYRAWEDAAGKITIAKDPAAEPGEGTHMLHALRVGVVHPWKPVMDEGWTRFVLDRHGVGYTEVGVERIRAGELERDFDVLVLASMSRAALVDGWPATKQIREFSGGIGKDGLANLHAFVAAGGKLVAWGASVNLLLPVPGEGVDAANALAGDARKAFYCPGSLLDVERPSTAAAAGFEPTFSVYQRDACALAGESVEPLLRYTEKPLRSGYLKGAEKIAGKIALGRIRSGKGTYLLFGFRPQNRGQTLGTFPLLLHALLGGD